MDRKANVAFYGDTTMSPERIFVSSPNIAPAVANTFVQILTAQTRRLPKQPGMQTGVASAVVPNTDNASTVRTFGMPDPDESSSTPDSDDYDPNY